MVQLGLVDERGGGGASPGADYGGGGGRRRSGEKLDNRARRLLKIPGSAPGDPTSPFFFNS